MHMADALISPAVGGTMMAVTAGVAAYSVNKINKTWTKRNSVDGGHGSICVCRPDD